MNTVHTPSCRGHRTAVPRGGAITAWVLAGLMGLVVALLPAGHAGAVRGIAG